MARRKRKVVNRDRSEYRGAARKRQNFDVKHRGGTHGDERKERSKRAARDQRLWD